MFQRSGVRAVFPILSVLFFLILFSSCNKGEDSNYIWYAELNNSTVQGEGDPSFYLEEICFGRPLFDENGTLVEVINPESLMEYDPITGAPLDGFPKPLNPDDSLERLHGFQLGEKDPPFQKEIVPRNAALVLDFSIPLDPDCLNLDEDLILGQHSPIQIMTESGEPVPFQAIFLEEDKVVLNPVCLGNAGFPPCPIMFDQAWKPRGSASGFLKIFIYSAGTGPHCIRSFQSTELACREDYLGSPVNPIGFNPGNALLDFIKYKDFLFNGFLPDLSSPRIMREVRDAGVVDTGSDYSTIVDLSKNFNVLANQGKGEWANAWLFLRPGTAQEESLQVSFNTKDTLFLNGTFNIPPEPGVDDYCVKRAEYFEPIPGLLDLSTAVDPINHPKDPYDSEDKKNWNLFQFVEFSEWDEAQQAWIPVSYHPGPHGSNPIDPNWRISFCFSESMDLDSFRSYETFYVCDALLTQTNPGFHQMKPGRVTGEDFNRIISFEPVSMKGAGSQKFQLLGFGGKEKKLRLVMRVIPPQGQIEAFYHFLGPDPATWPPEVKKDLMKVGVLGITSQSGQPLGLPLQLLDVESPFCVIYPKSPGRGAFPPAVDLAYRFSTQEKDPAKNPETGSMLEIMAGDCAPFYGEGSTRHGGFASHIGSDLL